MKTSENPRFSGVFRGYRSSILWRYLAYFPASAQNFFPKKFLIFFPKKTCSEKVPYIFSKKKNSLFLGNGTTFRERYIQNHGVFRTRGIFRTLSNIGDGMFWKK